MLGARDKAAGNEGVKRIIVFGCGAVMVIL
jgi:hypothetical protein